MSSPLGWPSLELSIREKDLNREDEPDEHFVSTGNGSVAWFNRLSIIRENDEDDEDN